MPKSRQPSSRIRASAQRWHLRLFRWWCAFVARVYRHLETDPSRLPVSRLKNLEPHLCRRLEQLGVLTRADLVRLGALEVFQQLRQHGADPSAATLFALHGAIVEQSIKQISEKEKAYLLEEANACLPKQVR
jgi:hypothetical protein